LPDPTAVFRTEATLRPDGLIAPVEFDHGRNGSFALGLAALWGLAYGAERCRSRSYSSMRRAAHLRWRTESPVGLAETFKRAAVPSDPSVRVCASETVASERTATTVRVER
jgi:hypothetical protein